MLPSCHVQEKHRKTLLNHAMGRVNPHKIFSLPQVRHTSRSSLCTWQSDGPNPPIAIYKSLKGCRREYFVLRSKSWLRLSSFDSSFASCVVELVRFASCIDITWDILLSLFMPIHDRSSSQASKADNNVDIPSYVPICYPLDKVD
jgi:hypothetical protein